MPNAISLGDVDPGGHCGTVTEIVPAGGFAQSDRVRFTDGCLRWAGCLDQPPAHAHGGVQGADHIHSVMDEELANWADGLCDIVIDEAETDTALIGSRIASVI